jgi:hypothetical protein
MAIKAAMQYPQVGFGHDGGFAGKNASPRSPFLDNFRIADTSGVNEDIGYYLGLNRTLLPLRVWYQLYLHADESLATKVSIKRAPRAHSSPSDVHSRPRMIARAPYKKLWPEPSVPRGSKIRECLRAETLAAELVRPAGPRSQLEYCPTATIPRSQFL